MSSRQQSTFSLSGRPVLLATDGAPASAGATHVTHALATELQARPHTLVVIDTRGAPIPPPLDAAIQLASEVVGPGVHAEQAEAVHRGLAATLGQSVDWPVRMAVGTPAAAIVREASRIDAAMIVMGLRRHSRADRVLNDETTLNVVRTAPCPVFGVVPELRHLPKRILAAIDFSTASLEAASAARSLLPPSGRLILAYVSPLILYPPDDGEGVIHALGVQAGFDRASRELGAGGLTVDTVVLHHELKQQVSDLLIEQADATSADVIAAGSARLSRVDRWLLGSVSTDLIRGGRHSMLVVPPVRGRP
jgi:nucleotide-binding universal stress UspA family protein